MAIVLHAPVSTSTTGYERVAKDYEKGRPDYPLEAIALLSKELHLAAGCSVLDLAAGTGKLTKALRRSRYALIAVEPVAEMRAIFYHQFPEISITAGAAEAIPVRTNSQDAVVVGTAFHWFDGDKTLPEIARVLKPKGSLGLIWNIFDPDVAWVKEIRALLEKYEMHPTHDTLQWKAAFASTTLFGPLEHKTLRYSYLATAQEVINRLLSAKNMGLISQSEQQAVIDEALKILASHPETANKQKLQIPYRVEIYWCRKV